MAANCACACASARQTLNRISSSAAKTLFTSSSSSSSSSSSQFASKATNLTGLAASKPASASRSAFQKLSSSGFRLPVQLAGLQSMLPLHSATAAALFTSQLSLHKDKWGCLSEGFATPL